mgnify:CR=1 FL=1
MFEKRLLKRKIVLTVIVLLMFSIILNIYTAISIKKYKYKIGQETYSAIENMKFLHESNQQVLSVAIDIGNIENMGILKLYKNYNDLAEETSRLWNEYIYYEQNRKFTIYKKNIDTSDISVNDVNTKLEDFFNSMLEVEMQTQDKNVELKEEMLEKFKEIYDLECEKTAYYNDFCKEKVNGVMQDKKKDIIIKKHYWMDILQGYNEINKKYVDYEFKVN